MCYVILCVGDLVLTFPLPMFNICAVLQLKSLTACEFASLNCSILLIVNFFVKTCRICTLFVIDNFWFIMNFYIYGLKFVFRNVCYIYGLFNFIFVSFLDTYDSFIENFSLKYLLFLDCMHKNFIDTCAVSYSLTALKISHLSFEFMHYW